MIVAEKRRSVRNDPAFLLAILYTFGFYAFVMALLIRAIPPENKELVSQLLPVLSMIQGGIIQYFYNKAHQATAEKKDDTIKKLADTAQTTASTAAALAPTPPAKPDIQMTADTVNVTEKGETK